MDPNIQGSFLFNNSLNQFPSDLKAPVCQYSVPNSFYKLNPGLNTQLQPGTPHGISDILSRSMVGVGTTGTTTLLSGYSPMGGFGPSVTSTSMYYNRDYNPSLGGFSKSPAECPMKGRSMSCWAESSCDWRGGRQQCTGGESAKGFSINLIIDQKLYGVFRTKQRQLSGNQSDLRAYKYDSAV